MAEEHVAQGVIKVVELVGVSQKGFSDAVRQAVHEASKSIRGINGVEVQSSQATVKDGELAEYRVNVKIAFPVERAS
jgi:dodecin